jgi:hypothetical protein
MIGLGLGFVLAISYFDENAGPDLFNTAKVAK